MASVLWMLFVVSCPLVLPESGDDLLDEVTCTSTLTFDQTNLICSLDEPSEDVRFIQLCKKGQEPTCTNATQRPRDFIFKNLIKTATYELQIGFFNYIISKDIELVKIVKIPAPEMKFATYTEDTEEVFICFDHSHEFVQKPKFELEVWKDGVPHKNLLPGAILPDKNFTFSRDRLSGDGVYYTHVRAKPWEFFDGDWSEWSKSANFTIKSSENNIPVVGFIITFFVILVLIIGLGTLRWREQIKDYITPNIPHPKATLAQMQRGLPFTFSPEVFSDVFIHRVDYVDEKPSAPELQDGLGAWRYSQASSSGTSVSEMDMKADECLPREQSHLKIRLLDESDLSKEREHGSSQSETAPRRECKDEAYVTMSSLFKTQ